MADADAKDRMGPLVRLCAIVASAVVSLSLVLFVIDQSSMGTENQVNSIDGRLPVREPAEINRPNPGSAAEAVRERVHSGTREKIDDADDVLLSPFSGIVSDGSVWAARLVPAALALLLYGLGGLVLANYFTGGARETRDWRESGT